jgi:SAM-dependent methyltransferase
VVGIDRDAERVATARRSHNKENLEYRQMDCQRPDLPSESFDVVVSNALFEYLDDFDGFMAQSTRLLVPGGLFLSGTKNLLLSLRRPDGAPLYRNHEQEFTADSLRSKLEEYYQDVEVYGEIMSARAKAYLMNDRALGLERITVGLGIKHAIPRSWRKAVRRWLTGVELAELTEEDFQIVAHSLDEAFYLVGRGRRA